MRSDVTGFAWLRLFLHHATQKTRDSGRPYDARTRGTTGLSYSSLPEALNQVRQPLLPQRSQPSARRILAVDSDLNVSLGRILNLGMCP